MYENANKDHVEAPIEKAAEDEKKKPGFFSLRFGFWGVIAAGAMINLAATVLGFAGRLHWALDLFNSFRVQYAVTLTIAAILFSIGRKWKQLTVCAIGAVINASLILPIYIGSPAPIASHHVPQKLMVMNLYTANTNYADTVAYILKEDPHFVALMELDMRWWEGLAEIRERFPYHIESVRSDNFGIALFSKTPFVNARKESLSAAEVATIIAEIDCGGGQATLIVTHPVPPVGSEYTRNRNEQLVNLAELAQQTSGHVIMAGDFNAPPWSPYFKQLVRDSGLRDSRQGFGIQPTWPSFRKMLYTPIDHVLVSESVNVHERRVGPANGSDHHPVVMVFSLD